MGMIDGYVCDVTAFVPEHPGGDEITGSVSFGHDKFKDATFVFYNSGGVDMGHSEYAITKMKTFRIGKLDPKAPGMSSFAGGDDSGAMLMVAVPVILIGVAAAWYFFMKRK